MRSQLLLERARSMRREMPEPERRLWHALRAGRLEGAKFRRQVVIRPYIVDFACRTPRMIVIEVDGETHAARQAYDAARTVYLNERGYQVLRFTNPEVTANLDGILSTVSDALRTPPLPTLSSEGEREKGW